MSSWDFGDSASTTPSTPDVGTPSAAPPPRRERFDEAPVTLSSGSASVSAPLHWLVIGVLVALLAIGLNLVTASAAMAAVAWALGGPLAMSFLAIFIKQDLTRRANPWYAESQLTMWGRRLLVVLSLTAVALSAWTIADHLSRRGS
jgi:hypothetical protein